MSTPREHYARLAEEAQVTVLTDDQRIVAAAVDVIVSVSAQLLHRNGRKVATAQGLASTVVDPYALLALANMIENRYPGVIEKSRTP